MKTYHLKNITTISNFQSLIKTKTMKTVNISPEMIAIRFAIVGPEKFAYFLEKIYLKNNGDNFIAYNNYVKTLNKMLERLNINPKDFSLLKKPSDLYRFQTQVNDLLNPSSNADESKDIQRVVKFYTGFVLWVNNNTPQASITPTYAQAA